MRKGFCFAIFAIIFSTISLIGCCWMGIADINTLSPSSMIQENEIVFLGDLISLDTLISLGEVRSDISPLDIYIVEYTFRPNERFTATNTKNSVHLWYCLKVEKSGSYNNSIDFSDSNSNLVYGNRLTDTNKIINLYRPSTHGSVDSLFKMLSDSKQNLSRAFSSEDSTICERIFHSQALKLLLVKRNDSGQVICGLEPEFTTLHSYLRDVITYCDFSGLWARTVSAKNYVENLRKESRSLQN